MNLEQPLYIYMVGLMQGILNVRGNVFILTCLLRIVQTH